MRVILARLAFLLAGLASPAVAGPAPDIVGKSVLVTWTENRQVQRADGTANTASFREARIYISSTGHPFTRLTAATRRSATNEQVGTSGTSLQGGQQAVRVDGHTIVIQSEIGNWAMNLRVEVAPCGSGCSAQISFGKEVGSAPKAFRSAMSGMMTEVHAVSASGASCAVQQGNVFAN
jgi:hypothetical protein